MKKPVALPLWLLAISLTGLSVEAQELAPQTASIATTKQPARVVVPAGTRVMMQLISPLDSESAVEGSGLYLETLFPVIVGDRVAIPAHTYVQGIMEAEKRAGHFARRAEFSMRFKSLTFATGDTVSLNGDLLSLPGSRNVRRQANGNAARVDQLDQALPSVAAGALAGAVIGSVRRDGIGSWKTGAALGGGLATGAVLITRGDPIHLPEGTKVEMALTTSVSVPEQPAQPLLNATTLANPDKSPSSDPNSDRKDARHVPGSALGLILGSLR